MTDEFDPQDLSAGESAFFEALEREGHPSTEPLSAEDLALIERALDQDELPSAGTNDGSGGGRVALIASLVAVAAALLVWVAWPVPDQAQVDRGQWSTLAGDSAASGDALPMAVWLVADDDEACGRVDKATLCADRGTVVKFIVDDRGRTRAELEKGRVTVASGHWTVVTDKGEQTLETGQSLSVAPQVVATRERTPAKPKPPQEDPPQVVDPPAGESDTEATETPKGPSSKPAPSTDPGTLLARARTLRGQGDAKGGARTYAQLLRDHPRSPEANVARVSLGQLRLESGRPKAALSLFEKYLRRGGSLSEEALWGKIRALNALGRKAQLRRAVEELERKYPRSVYRSRARSLLK